MWLAAWALLHVVVAVRAARAWRPGSYKIGSVTVYTSMRDVRRDFNTDSPAYRAALRVFERSLK